MTLIHIKTAILTGLMTGLLLLSGCAYHLVGHGGGSGAIPADITSLTVSGNAEAKLISQLRQRLQSDRYSIVDSSAVTDISHHATVFLNIYPLVFTPSAFDISGVATQYRMTFTGALKVNRGDQTIWQSGLIQRQGDVFVTGGPTSIEASKQRLQQDLSKQWLSDAVGRIRAGF